MARYYGTLQGARGPTSRLGSPSSGLEVTAQSYQGDIVVRFWAHDDADHVAIYARTHSGGFNRCFYSGPVSDLVDEKLSLVERMAHKKLEEEFA